MCAERLKPTPIDVGGGGLSDDPTLDAPLDQAPGDAAFPDTAPGAHIVLYQCADGGIEVRWHLDAEALAHARGAFGDSSDAPEPVLRLCRLGDGGASRIIADAVLDDRHLVADGRAHWPSTDATGLLQAEIGLSTVAGGWVLVARSNQLQAVAPVGAPFLRTAVPAPSDGAAASQAVPGEIASSHARRPLPAPDERSPAFPLVQPAPGIVRTLDHPPAADRAGVSADGDSITDFPTPGAEPPDYIDRSLASAPALFVSEPGVMPVDHPSSNTALPAPGISPSASAEGVPVAGSSASASDRHQGGPMAAQDDRVQMDALPRPGSGPVRAFATSTVSELRAEVLVHGSAAPGTVLDLGGHAYRVGAGGRFALRIPLCDRTLILRLLATLPELPVESRVPDAEFDERGD